VFEHFECEELLLVGHVWTMDFFLHMCTLLEVLFSLCVFNCEVLQWQAVTTKLSWVLQKFVFSSVPFDP
jgi:hypothetical protein